MDAAAQDNNNTNEHDAGKRHRADASSVDDLLCHLGLDGCAAVQIQPLCDLQLVRWCGVSRAAGLKFTQLRPGFRINTANLGMCEDVMERCGCGAMHCIIHTTPTGTASQLHRVPWPSLRPVSGGTGTTREPLSTARRRSPRAAMLASDSAAAARSERSLLSLLLPAAPCPASLPEPLRPPCRPGCSCRSCCRRKARGSRPPSPASSARAATSAWPWPGSSSGTGGRLRLRRGGAFALYVDAVLAN